MQIIIYNIIVIKNNIKNTEESNMGKIFETDKKIRLGIWGLGRGSAFLKAAAALNFEIVAGCDFNENLRNNFKESCPDAFITDNEDEFLQTPDMDAVLIATFFTSHAANTIKALEHGLHVMCEVTSFFTPAEGVQVVEAVEKSGKVYNLLENYPFTKENFYLAKLYREGFFGEFQYAEFEYLHDCRILSFCYSNGTPVEPGYHAHDWRSVTDFHYYNTHSLGPLMQITNLRPVSIAALPMDVSLAGTFPDSNWGKPCASLIKMSNGGTMRNLCGSSTGNYHMGKRFWGTLAAAESLENNLQLTIGAYGSGTKIAVTPDWETLGKEADENGHGGGDFWGLYYFAREILYGTPAPWNIYSACDVTLAGIMAVKSHYANGALTEIPDFRDKAVREKYRNDHFRMTCSTDPHKIFPANHNPDITSKYNTVMHDLFKKSTVLRTALDGAKIFDVITDDSGKLAVMQNIRQAITELDGFAGNLADADLILENYPDSPAAYALKSLKETFAAEFAGGTAALRKKLEDKLNEYLKK